MYKKCLLICLLEEYNFKKCAAFENDLVPVAKKVCFHYSIWNARHFSKFQPSRKYEENEKCLAASQKFPFSFRKHLRPTRLLHGTMSVGMTLTLACTGANFLYKLCILYMSYLWIDRTKGGIALDFFWCLASWQCRGAITNTKSNSGSFKIVTYATMSAV